MFPSPTAEPETARINASRDDHWPCNELRFSTGAVESAMQTPELLELARF